ncbi:MAG: ATP phosphoribosyltransferase [Nitrospirae bacterium]|nr:ATP phosphoribosyltransferase [Nitrospirota bacterium]
MRKHTPFLKVALPKGKVQDPILDLLVRAGFRAAGRPAAAGALRFSDPTSRTEFYIVRDRDIPTFVEYGVCDVGMVGKDVLMEQEKDVYEPLDLGLGRCRLVWCGPSARGGADRTGRMGRNGGARASSVLGSRVATKYPRLTARFFESHGRTVEVVELYGSIELAPSLGLADSVVDLVQTGSTLRSVGLAEIETIQDISTWVILNRAASKLRYEEIHRWLSRVEKAVGR